MIRNLLAGLALLMALPAGAAAIRVTDDAGQTLTFDRPPQRIVSLTPHLTELLYAVGAGAQVVGVDSASDYPAAARALPRVGDTSRIRFERILALKPDLIVAWVGGNRAADVYGIAQLGIPVLNTEATRLGDVARLLRLIGEATGHAQVGIRAARTYDERLAALKQRYARSVRIPVFYQIWDRPLMSVGGVHWIDEALAVCGARNIFHDLLAVAPVVSREAVLRRQPQLIVGGSDAPGVRATWEAFDSLPAVRHGAFVQIDADRLHRATPRLIEGVATLCEALADYR
ncbi:MAG: cobalamin-binding protein [Thiobacillus sp. 65-69]|nr:MAG: cobalamin-binding protein [Thiobacillus sp. SCN 65-179]OJW37544.1 MAG: cobalamin-binding protein [Thiobacillus sp. 65-69]